MANIAIIPARGGSKRIPRKNIKSFLGKSIIAYSIESAIKSGLFDEIMVSTDDKEIAEIAKKHGAKVPFLRSNEKANDFATTFDVLVEVFEEYKSIGKVFDNACCIYATAPFVTEQMIIRAFDRLKEYNYDSVFPVLKYSFPIQRALKKDEKSGRVEMFYPENLNVRSQDLESSFHDSGQFYFFKVKNVLNKRKILTDNTGCIELSECEGQDIDNLSDWKLAELKYKLINEENNTF